MGRFLLWFFAVLGVIFVILGVSVTGGVWYMAHDRTAPLPERMALTLDFREPISGGSRTSALRRAIDGAPATLHETIEAIDRAAQDDRVAALVGHFGGDVFGLATAQELRAAVLRFRATGKPALAYAESFGEFGPGNVSYYLATAFDEIWMQPIGTLGLTGIHAAVPFAADALDSFGVSAEFARRGAYKSAPESLTERGFTDAHREMVESLTGDLYGQLVAGIAEGRRLAAGDVRRLIDEGPWFANAAESAGLIDGLAQRDELPDLLAEKVGDSSPPRTIGPDHYLAGRADDDSAGTPVAVIYATGLITSGESTDDPVFGTVTMGAETIAQAIEDAAADDRIRAIVLRIDSGGGSAVASEIIGRAVRRAAESDKPVVVSMAEAAASGGYWIAAYADEIVAQPATLTGSIGVFAGKIVTADLWDDLGVNWQGVSRGQNADIWASISPYTRDQAEKVDGLVERLYQLFLERVAEGRDLDLQSVERIAQGRVWTGAQALELGLVDRLGGLDVALAAALEAAGLPADAPVERVVFPEAPELWREVLSLLGAPVAGSIRAATGIDQLAPLLRRLQPLIADPSTRMLHMPPIVLGTYR